MVIKNENYKINLKIKHLFYAIFIFILILSLINVVYATDLEDTDLTNDNSFDIIENDNVIQSENKILSSGMVHNIPSSSTNDEIQTIFDNSQSGDTIQFNDRSYKNISIVVDKKLNIVSKKNSIIYGSNSICDKAKEKGISNSFAFYFTSLSSGSTIKGLTFTGNSDYEIMVEGGTYINIANNTISGGKKAGIYLNNSKYLNFKNNVVKNSYDGLVLNNVNRSNFTNNKIFSNKHDGMLLNRVILNNITHNRIYKNSLDGIHLENAKVNNIFYNNITDNNGSGLRLEGCTVRNKVSYNNISSNIVNIYANSNTTEDTITRNTLMYARVGPFYSEADNTGAAIVFGDGYLADAYSKMVYSYNSVGFNEQWDAKSTMHHPPVSIGANWYFDNDGNYGLGHICPMVFGGALDPEEFKHLSMGFGGDENGIFGQLFNGNTATGAGAFTIDNVNINGKDYGSVEVGEDGRFNLDLTSIPQGSNITITVNGHSFNITTDSNLTSYKTTENTDSGKIEEPEKRKPPAQNEKKVSKKEGTSSTLTGNGTGSGSGSSNGSGSGEGNFTGSGISVGTLSGQSNAGTGDSGQNGGGSASEGVSAYEILKQEPNPVTAKNSQLLAVFGVFLVIFIIALGYRSKNKNDFEDDGNLEL